MPISATGNNTRLPRDAGVTLVEAMVALVVIGLAVGVVLLLAPGPDRATREAAERLAARAIMAGDESIIVNRTMALVVTPEGYGFERLEDNGWAPAAFGSPLAFRDWPENVEARVEQTSAETGDARVARFDAFGGATPASIVISGSGARWRVRIDGQGEVHVAQAE